MKSAEPARHRRSAPPIVKVEQQRNLPLSYAQQRLWFLDQMQPGNIAYNMPCAWRLTGPLDVAALRMSLREIIRRHEVLRTTFDTQDGNPVQNIASQIDFELQEIDLTGIPVERRDAEAGRLAREEAQIPFDLRRGPLLRVKLFRLGEQEHVLLANMHHIVSDGWSIGILMSEISVLYGAFSSGHISHLPELSIQYKDFAIWQRKWLEGKPLEDHLAYWRKQLAGLQALEMPADRPRPAITSYKGATITFHLPGTLYQKLNEVSRREGATVFITLLAAFQVMLAKYAAQEDVPVGVAIANRTRKDIEGLIGFFVNTLVIRTDLKRNPSFTETIKRVRRVALDAYAHQDVPFERLVEELQPERDLSRTPFFQVMLVFQNVDLGKLRIPGLQVNDFPFAADGTVANHFGAKFDLTLLLREEGSGLEGSLRYATDLFDLSTVSSMTSHFQTVLQQILARPNAGLAELSLLSEKERQQMLTGLSVPKRERRDEVTICQLVSEHALAQPDQIALVTERGHLTYREIDERAGQLAGQMLAQGIGNGSRVGINMQQAEHLLVAVLAVLQSGAVFVPLEPGEPAPRRAFILADAGVSLVITEKACNADWEGFQHPLLRVDDDRQESGSEINKRPDTQPTADDIACVLYRSSPSGRPQGILITQGGLRSGPSNGEPAIGATDRVALHFGFSSETGYFEAFAALAAGARVVNIPADLPQSLREIATLLRRHAVTMMFASTELVKRLAHEFPFVLKTMRLIVCAGTLGALDLLRKGLKPDLLERAYGIRGCDETGGGCMLFPLATLPLGARAIAGGKQCYLLDQDLEPVPAGFVGEVFFGAETLSPGYYGDAARTATAFVPHPFSGSPGARLFRNGDVAHYRSDGSLAFHPRRDARITIGDVRIEMEEIERVLMQHRGVLEATVASFNMPEGLESALAAFFVPNQQHRVSPAELKQFLQERLPQAMIPCKFTQVEMIGKTVDGVVGRAALTRIAEADAAGGNQPAAPPRTEIEAELAEMWKDLFLNKRPGIHDNFFDLGGHSMLATRLIGRIRNAFQIEFALLKVFEAPTIAELASEIEHLVESGSRVKRPCVAPAPQHALLPLSYAQERLWFIEQLEPGSTNYNMAFRLRVRGSLDSMVLQKCIEEIVKRHSILRTSFPEHEGIAIQKMVVAPDIPIEEIDLRDLPEQRQAEEAERLAIEETGKPFDIGEGPLFRVRLLRLHDSECLLLGTMHHIVSDGWSIAITIRELSLLYRAFIRNEQPSLPELKLQYSDFALWQREWLKGTTLSAQLEYWKKQLAALPPLEIPTDSPRSASATHPAGTLNLRLSAQLTDDLKIASRQEGVTLFMVLMAGFQVLLSRYCGQTDIGVGTPVAGRTLVEVEGLIGLFVNTLVIRTDLGGSPTLKQLLQKTMKVAMDAYSNQDVPFEKVVEELQPERELGRTPLFQVMLVLQNLPEEKLDLPGLSVTIEEAPAQAAKFDLTLQWIETDGMLHGRLEYAADLIGRPLMERMLQHYQCILEAIARDREVQTSDIGILTPGECESLAFWNQTGAQYSAQCVHQLFEIQAQKTPEAVAVVFGKHRLNYRELNEKANQVGHFLRKKGSKPEMPVGIFMNRSLEMIIGLLGILKSGAPYVPLDPEYPLARLIYMLEDSQTRILLTQEQLAPTLATHVESVICLDTGWPLIAEESASGLNIDVALGNLIYVFYTSGSTGKPKGVAMAHRSSSNLIQWQIAAAGIQPRSKTLQFTSLSFGVSFQEIFSTLCGGGTLYLVDEATRKDAFALYELISSLEVERLFVPFVALQQIADVGASLDDKHSTLRWIFTAGEQLKVTPALEKFFSNSPGCVLENQYGATETHVVTSFRLAGPPGEWDSLPPIGWPIFNSQVYVRDGDGKPVPVGVVGDLYLAGEGLARGYLNRPELTAEKFIPDALGTQPGRRLYRTGDRARRKENGSLELLGRADHQVKIRGYRIELGEIESVLLEHPDVRQAALLCVEKQAEKQLIAYVVQREGATLTATELGAHLRRTLPEHAVPSAWSFLEKLPLTPSGKIDRGSLPAIEVTQSIDHGDPRNQTERILSRIWAQMLGRSRVGIHDSFFDMGGHSILAVRLIVAVRNQFKCNIPLQSLFRYPTIAEFVQILVQEEPELAPARLVEIQPQGTRLPIFFVHPVGGSVFCHSDRARALGTEQPFYGLQSSLTDVDQLETIEQMAAVYNLEIKKVQKRGPYFLGGWSMGGLVAFEMARQLRQEGEITGMLILVDTHPFQSGTKEQSDRASMIPPFAAYMARVIGINISDLETQFLKLQPEEQWVFLLEALIAENILARETAEAELTGMFRVFVRNLSAANKYRIQPTEQKIVLLAAEDGLDPRRSADEWASRTGSAVEFHLVPGNHYSMMRAPNVQILAACLQRCLDFYVNGLAMASDTAQSTVAHST